jgi:hypothetical protein
MTHVIANHSFTANLTCEAALPNYSLTRFGTDGLAFATTNGQVVFVHSALIPNHHPSFFCWSAFSPCHWLDSTGIVN